MNDCQNAEMRDQLPDLLHERLAATERAVVMAHLDGCVDCRDELALLRVAHGTLIKATPRIDLNFIVEALPKTAPRTRTLSVSRRPMWSGRSTRPSYSLSSPRRAERQDQPPAFRR